MADDAIEEQLEAQLAEQKDSLAAAEGALSQDPDNQELLQIRQDLCEAIQLTEESLLRMKQDRLLRYVDEEARANVEGAGGCEGNRVYDDGYETQLLPSMSNSSGDPSVSYTPELQTGSKCRFKGKNGRWYSGEILFIDEDENHELQDFKMNDSNGLGLKIATLQILYPTRDDLLMCKYFVRNRCHFGAECRYSHGIRLPLTSLLPFSPTNVMSFSVGDRVLARTSTSFSSSTSSTSTLSNLWKEAIFESYDEDGEYCQVKFVYNGKKAELKKENITVFEGESENVFGERENRSMEGNGSRNSNISGIEDESGNESEYEDDDEDAEEGDEVEAEDAEERHFASSWFSQIEAMASIGVQTETENFAEWEKHTRGIASKMMLAMGFKVGSGLGLESQGITEPITVRFLTGRESLDHLFRGEEGGEGEEERKRSRKRRGRGGERRRRQKLALAKKEEEEAERKRDEMRGAADVFDFINSRLVTGNGMEKSSADMNKSTSKSTSDERGRVDKLGKSKKVEKGINERRELVVKSDVIHDLNSKLQKLEHMAKRNSKDSKFVSGVKKKMEEVYKELEAVKSQHDMAKKEIHQKNMHSKWVKF